ncbi:DnaD domain protein [Evansella clarkii]|uniref:DnaD domain protein n=1 Tax=Evansella clarkii TaxID=79879 RepID=UPI0009968442|nr:DnaD domain protein [Evansella clarkii]
MNTGNAVVDSIGKFHISGTVIPFPWFKHLTFDSGKPYTAAIFILADIVYWYRPTIERDEASGVITKVKKKFASDMLQRDYGSFAEQFGLTKRQAKHACDYLEEGGFIIRDFRTITVKGKVLNNVMFVAPVPDGIEYLTYNLPDDTLLHSNVPPSYIGEGDPPTLERKTNTKIITEIKYLEKEEEKARANPFDFYQQNFGMLSSYMSEKISMWLDEECFDEPEEVIVLAMQIALENNVRNFNYVSQILKDWCQSGAKNKQQAEALIKEYKNRKKGGAHGNTQPNIAGPGEEKPRPSEALERRKRILEGRKN